MAETYFEYVLSQYRLLGIKSICAVFSKRSELIENANKSFNGVTNITADWRLIQALKNCFDNSTIITARHMNSDAREVYDRCYNAIYVKGILTYDRLFDILVDFNWVMAGFHNSKNKQFDTVRLQEKHVELRNSIKEYLLEIYNKAIEDNNECVYINEALTSKKKIFYVFKYAKSRDYALSDYTSYELQVLEHDLRDSSISGMSLFYGLTATAALTEYLRRLG